MSEISLQNIKQRLPLFGGILAGFLTIVGLWFLINYLIVLLIPKIPRPIINTVLNQNLIAPDVSVDSSINTFENFKKVTIYKKNVAEKVDRENLASKFGLVGTTVKKGDTYTWSKGDERLKIDTNTLYLEYNFDTTKSSVFYQTGSRPVLENVKQNFTKLLSQLKFSSGFINSANPLVTYSQGLQGLSEINPKPVVIPPSQADTITLTYQYSFMGKPLFGDYPEIMNATAQYSMNNRLIHLRLPLLQGMWQEGSSYKTPSANELIQAINKGDATLVSYNYTTANVGRPKDQLKVIRLKKINAGFLVNTDSLFPTYLIETDSFTESGFGVNAVFYLPAISAKFFQ